MTFPIGGTIGVKGTGLFDQVQSTLIELTLADLRILFFGPVTQKYNTQAQYQLGQS
jgi:hypothetical protein